MSHAEWPELPLESWKESRTTLHLMTQIVGKVRLELHPKINHWWHAPLYVSARGLTTRSIPYQDKIIELEFDLVSHLLHMRSSSGRSELIDLRSVSVAQFYEAVLLKLKALDVDVSINPQPFDPDKVGSDIPFDKDSQHSEYDREYVRRFWTILTRIDPIFKSFRSRFVGKCSPVHLFWHSLDLAVTRFSGRSTKVPAEADPVTKEAYSHEVISAGFWAGDNSFPEAAFYAYVHPEPKGLAEKPLQPAKAVWNPINGTHMAVYRYADFRTAADPKKALLDFLQSTYEAGADLTDWPRKELELAD